MNEETITISKKEYELLKKHQKEYGILINILAENEYYIENGTITFAGSTEANNIVMCRGAQLIIRAIGEEFKEEIKNKDKPFKIIKETKLN